MQLSNVVENYHTEREIGDIPKQTRKSRIVDLCFLVDATISMKSPLEIFKLSIHHIVKQLRKLLRRRIVEHVRLGFVAYRDFGDKPSFQVHPFNKSVIDFHCFCDNLEATGGDDAAGKK